MVLEKEVVLVSHTAYATKHCTLHEVVRIAPKTVDDICAGQISTISNGTRDICDACRDRPKY